MLKLLNYYMVMSGGLFIVIASVRVHYSVCQLGCFWDAGSKWPYMAP
nr:hypothetical protein - human adenovirus 12 [Human adenovirus 12]